MKFEPAIDGQTFHIYRGGTLIAVARNPVYIEIEPAPVLRVQTEKPDDVDA